MTQNLEGAPFVVKTFQIIEDINNSPYITWGEEGKSFIVLNPVEFSSQVLPRYFKHSNFCSFIRQLNTYGFQKVESTNWEFRHDFFSRSEPQLLKQILRRKSKKRDAQGGAEDDDDHETLQTQITPQKPQTQTIKINETTPTSNPPLNSSPSSNIDHLELEKLKSVNHLLTKEVIRLQQQQDEANANMKRMQIEIEENRRAILKLNTKLLQISSMLNPSFSLNPSPSNYSSFPSTYETKPKIDSPSSLNNNIMYEQVLPNLGPDLNLSKIQFSAEEELKLLDQFF